jgi:type I restriction enzyme, S subunit
MQISYPSEGYKQTNFIYGKYENIPEGWNIVQIKEIADVKGGKRIPLGEKLTNQHSIHISGLS